MITSASARRRSRSSRLPEPVAPGGRKRAAEGGPGLANFTVEPASRVDQPDRRIARLDLGTVIGADPLGSQDVDGSHEGIPPCATVAANRCIAAGSSTSVLCPGSSSFGLGEIPQDQDAHQSLRMRQAVVGRSSSVRRPEGSSRAVPTVQATPQRRTTISGNPRQHAARPT